MDNSLIPTAPSIIQLDDRVYSEAIEKQDIMIGNFLDTYHNLTIKHELAIRWITQNCPDSSLLLKADDDAFVDIKSLLDFLERTFGENLPNYLLACDSIPEGTAPQREGKWAVTYKQYPHQHYPQYCSGLSYIMSLNVAKKLVKNSNVRNWFWIDDVCRLYTNKFLF